MRIAILGAGATGKAFAFFLSRQNDLLLIAKKDAAFALRKGLSVKGVESGHLKPDISVFPSSKRELADIDYLIIALKTYDTHDALSTLRSHLPEDVPVVSFQNGFDNFSIIRNALPNPVVSGTTTLAVTQLDAASIKIVSKGITLTGALDKRAEPHALTFSRILRSVGLEARFSRHILKEIWLKSVSNACINPLTALTRRNNGAVCEIRELRSLSMSICVEASRIAEMMHLTLSPSVLFRKVMRVAEATSANRSSMLVDVEKGRKTEIEQLNGYLVDMAEKAGIDAPVNRTILMLVKGASSAG
jgi:2-dehydropantoate 2-reductase